MAWRRILPTSDSVLPNMSALDDPDTMNVIGPRRSTVPLATCCQFLAAWASSSRTYVLFERAYSDSPSTLWLYMSSMRRRLSWLGNMPGSSSLATMTRFGSPPATRRAASWYSRVVLPTYRAPSMACAG